MRLCQACSGYGHIKVDGPHEYPCPASDPRAECCRTCRGTSRALWRLLATPLNDDERAAEKLDPRPGFGLWRRLDKLSYHTSDITHDKVSKLDQPETDAAILRELYNHLVEPEQAEFVEMFGLACIDDQAVEGRIFLEQRGGFHSDAIVRAYAWRAWGHRDQLWIRPRPPHEAPNLQNIPRERRSRGRDPRRNQMLHQQGCEDPNCDGQCIR